MRYLALALLLAACGGDDTVSGVDGSGGGGGDGGGVGGDGGGGGGGDGGGGGEGWTTLISGEWTMPAGDEGYVCVRKTLAETTWVKAFRPIIPVGTHHTVLTVGSPQGADGTFSCGVATNASSMIYGSGVGTNELFLPDGVAVRLEAGQQLNLNLHLYNTNDSAPLTGTSGTEVQVVAEADVQNEAEVILAGPVGWSLGSSSIDRVVEGDCTLAANATVFATGPHMHRLGKYMRVWAGATEIMDRAYTFDEQTVTVIDPVAMTSGQKIHVECTYEPTPATMWGDSTDQEMCFASAFLYPPIGGSYLCVF